MTEKEMKKAVEQSLLEGKSYQEVFEEFNAKFPRREMDIAKLVAEVPSLSQRERYSGFRIGIIVAMSATMLVLLIGGSMHVSGEATIWGALEFILIAPTLYILIGILNWKKSSWLQLVGMSMAMVIGLVRFGVRSLGLEPFLIVEIACFGVVALLPSLAYLQLGGKFTGTYFQERDAKGQIWTRYRVQFKQ